MRLETLATDGCRTHLIAAERTREAVLVDPLIGQADALLALLKERGLALRWVVDTHTHADHLSAGALFLQKSGASYLMHDNARAACVTKRVAHGEKLGVGEVTLEFLHVPGHTRDSMMIALPGALLTGDFLFLGRDGAGRLDLPGGDAGAHYESLRRLDAFKDGVEVRPGHDYRGRAVSSLKDERAANPVLRPRSREEYLRYWAGLKQDPAEWMGAVVAANGAGTTDPDAAPIPKGGYSCAAGGACAADPAEPAVTEWTPQEVAAKLRARAVKVIDVREPDEYSGELGRIAGSRLIPLDELPARVAEVPPGPVVAVCRSGKRSARGAVALMKSGRKDVYSMAGGMLAWNDAGLPVEYA